MLEEDMIPENGHEAIVPPSPARIPIPHVNSDRLLLDGGNYAVAEHGIIQIFLKDERHLFSVDANTVPFERKSLGALLQVYLLGYQNGKATERANAKQRVLSAINLLFE